MKYLKYILGLIAILAIGYFLVWIINPKFSYDCEIIVDKSSSESWAVVQDEEKMPDWLAGLQKIERISGTPGTIGAVSDVHFDSEGQQMTIRETITDIVPNESISMSYHHDFMNMYYKMSLSPMNEKTKISTTTTVEGNGVFSKLITVLFGNSYIEQEQTNLSNLKKTIEENTKDYFQADGASIEMKTNQ